MIASARFLFSGLLALTAFPACLAVGAMAQTPEVELVGELTEELGNAAKISGARVVVGVTLQGMETDRRPTVEALFPGDWAGGLACARWLTSDALYWAYGTYRLHPGWNGAVANLLYPTGKADAIGALSAERMAVGITRGDCAEESLEFVPALWNATYSGDRQRLQILVNSRGADEVYVLGEDSIDVTCTAIGGGSTVGFDHVCSVPVRAQDGSLQLEVNRVRRGNPEDPVLISIAGVGAP